MRYSSGGQATSSFNLAVNENFTDSQGEKQTRTNWIRCVCFNRTAEVDEDIPF
jgi:single-stranded DNA-binding protein